MTSLNQKIDFCIKNIKEDLQEAFESSRVEMDMIYDDEEDYYHFVFLAQNSKQARELQDFLHDGFYDMDEFERQELYHPQKFPLMFTVSEQGLEELKRSLKEKIN